MIPLGLPIPLGQLINIGGGSVFGGHGGGGPRNHMRRARLASRLETIIEGRLGARRSGSPTGLTGCLPRFFDAPARDERFG
jgi:hypothetical protein